LRELYPVCIGNMILTKPSSRRKKTVVRAIRLTEELDEDLKAGAESNGITVTSLISSILTKYISVDKQSQSLGTIQVARQWFSHILDATSEESLRNYYPMMRDEWKSRIEFRTAHRLDFESFWKALEDTGIYSGLFQCNVIRSDPKRFSLTLHHTFGQKWSNFLEDVVSNMFTGLGAKILSHSTTPASITISGETP